MAGESVSALQQISTTLTLQAAAAADGNGTTITTDGYNGAQMIEVRKTGTGTTTLILQGSYDNVNFYAVGYYQVDAQATLARSASAIAVPGGTVNHVYQILDLYPFLQAAMSSTSGTVALTAKAYLVGI